MDVTGRMFRWAAGMKGICREKFGDLIGPPIIIMQRSARFIAAAEMRPAVTPRQHLTIVQYGDFEEAFHRLMEGGDEDYGYQRYSVEAVDSLTDRLEVTTICLGATEGRKQLRPGLFVHGVNRNAAHDRHAVGKLLDSLQPTMLVVRTPHVPTLAWAAGAKIPSLPLFADFISIRRPGDIRRAIRLAWFLHRIKLPCLANHSLSSTESMRVLGFPKRRLVPWEWPRPSNLSQPRAPRAESAPLSVFYAGALLEAKGVFTLLQAAELMLQRGCDVRITLAGKGSIDQWLGGHSALHAKRTVELLGQISNSAVQAAMRASDVVVVPTQHEYAEGFPKTILEALAARTPLVVSNHPAFVNRLRAEQDALVFRAGDPQDLAEQLCRLSMDGSLGARLTQNAPETLRRLHQGTEWAELLRCFVDDPGDRTGWVRQRSLEAR
jgi:glycosyltransferase involved in cell wall biosynthesis